MEWTSIPETFNFDAKLTEFTDVQFFFNEDATVTLGEPEGELEAIVNYQLYEAPLVDPDNITRLYYEEPIRTQSAVAILVPKGFWNLTFDDGQVIPSPDITAYFYVDSPTRITPTFIDEGESAEIYDMSGACIARKADKGTLRSLPAGIYLINGKKIIIR